MEVEVGLGGRSFCDDKAAAGDGNDIGNGRGNDGWWLGLEIVSAGGRREGKG